MTVEDLPRALVRTGNQVAVDPQRESRVVVTAMLSQFLDRDAAVQEHARAVVTQLVRPFLPGGLMARPPALVSATAPARIVADTSAGFHTCSL